MLFGNVARLFTILSTSGIATSVTVGMLIFNRNDKPIVREESQIFENIEIQADEFKKQEYFYSEDGTNDGKVFQITPEEYEKIKEVLDGKRKLVHIQASSGSEKQLSDVQNDAEPTRENGDDSVNIPQQPRDDSESLDTNELSKQASTGGLDKGKKEDSIDSGEESTTQAKSNLSEGQVDKVSLDSSDTESGYENGSSLGKNQEAGEVMGDLSVVEQEQKKDDESSKSKEIQSKQDDSNGQELTSDVGGSGSGEGPEDCKPCPKGKKDNQDFEENKQLNQSENMDTVSQNDHEAQQRTEGEDNAPDSDMEESSRETGEGVLDEGGISSLLTSPEQLKELEGLYGKVDSVLGQLSSKFGLQ